MLQPLRLLALTALGDRSRAGARTPRNKPWTSYVKSRRLPPAMTTTLDECVPELLQGTLGMLIARPSGGERRVVDASNARLARGRGGAPVGVEANAA